MSHQVLARKWRPRTFETLVGQDHVVRALSHALTTGRLHHAYLFTGTRGVGKTTIARILAKAVNCETGLTPTPCGACSACEQIDSGRFVDYVELDAASNRGVDEMAQLLDNAVYAPTMGRYKVFVIDEVHMLSTHAFNAMLKTLEEPPPHLLFILATTDPQKVPVTVLSRCMQFNLRNMRPAAIAGHLARVLEAERVPADAAALDLIGRSAAGSMRDALSLTDQAIGFGAGQVREAHVREMLGVLDGRFVEQLLDALADRDGAALVAISQQVAEQNVSAQRLLADLAERFCALAVLEALGAGAGEHGDGHLAGAAPWQGRFSPQDLQVYYQAAIYGQRDLSLAPDTATGLLMALLRMFAFAVDEADTGASPVPGGGDGSARPERPAPAALTAALAPPAGHRAAAPGLGDRPSPRTAVLAADAPSRSGPAPADDGERPALAALRAVRAVRDRAGRGREAGTPPASRPLPDADEDPHGAGRASPPTRPGRPLPLDGPPPGRFDDPADPGFSPDSEDQALPDDDDRPVAPALPVASPAEPGAAPTVSRATGSFDGDWPALATRLQLPGRLGEFMRQSEFLGREGDRFEVRVPIQVLADDRLLQRVGEALSMHFGEAVQLRVHVGAIAGQTAAGLAELDRARRLEQARETIRSDPFVQSLQTEFGAQIVPESIRPLAAPTHSRKNDA